jgi:hypothetical protein
MRYQDIKTAKRFRRRWVIRRMEVKIRSEIEETK